MICASLFSRAKTHQRVHITYKCTMTKQPHTHIKSACVKRMKIRETYSVIDENNRDDVNTLILFDARREYTEI